MSDEDVVMTVLRAGLMLGGIILMFVIYDYFGWLGVAVPIVGAMVVGCIMESRQ